MKRQIILGLMLLFLINACKKREFDNPEDFAGQIEMITVGGGEYTEGKDDYIILVDDTLHQEYSPAHRVTLNSFKISKYEITTKQFCLFLNDIHCASNGYYNNTLYASIGSQYSNIKFVDREFIPYQQDKENQAVYSVTWYGADAYCKWAKGRLPTEAEWEYAARGGKNSNNYEFSGSNILEEVYDGCEPQSQVGTKKPNELGIYNMTGSAAEWCQDWYSSYTISSQNNPHGPDNGTKRVIRGSCDSKVYERYGNLPSACEGIRFVRDN